LYLKVKLSNLNLDDHAKKKLIKLVGERYCKDTDMLTITTDRYGYKKEKKNACSNGRGVERAACLPVISIIVLGNYYIFRAKI